MYHTIVVTIIPDYTINLTNKTFLYKTQEEIISILISTLKINDIFIRLKDAML